MIDDSTSNDAFADVAKQNRLKVDNASDEDAVETRTNLVTSPVTRRPRSQMFLVIAVGMGESSLS